MVYEETTESLFPADLLTQPGDQPKVVTENLGRETRQFFREVGIFPAEYPVRVAIDRIEGMDPRWIRPMHGGSLPWEATHYYFHALRNEPFAFEGKLFGRMLPGFAAPAIEEGRWS